MPRPAGTRRCHRPPVPFSQGHHLIPLESQRAWGLEPMCLPAPVHPTVEDKLRNRLSGEKGDQLHVHPTRQRHGLCGWAGGPHALGSEPLMPGVGTAHRQFLRTGCTGREGQSPIVFPRRRSEGSHSKARSVTNSPHFGTFLSGPSEATPVLGSSSFSCV